MKAFLRLHVGSRHDLFAFLIDAPLENAGSCAHLELHLEAKRSRGDGRESNFVSLIGGHTIRGRRVYFLPILALAVENPPTLWQLARIVLIILDGPINLDGTNLFLLREVVLYPLCGSLSAEPDEARKIRFVRILRQELIVKSEQGRRTYGSRGPGGGSDGGQEFTDAEEDGIRPRRMRVQCRGRCFFPVPCASAAVANKKVTERTTRRDVVRVVFILYVLEAGHARRRVGQLELRVAKGLGGGQRSKEEGGRKKQRGDRAQKHPPRGKVSACNVAQCI